MPKTEKELMSFDEFDECRNPPPAETDFSQIVDRVVSRRSFLGASVAFGASAFVMGTTALRPAPASAAPSRLAFKQVATNTLDTVTVPEGYSWHIAAKWGDPMWSNSIPFDEETRGTGISQELSFGDNNDGMAMFADGDRNILAVNNEYTNRSIIHGNRESGLAENADDVRKSKAAHGVSIIEVEQKDGRWSIVVDSPYNRRITADTPMEITGPARGHDLLKTAADPSGTTVLGTYNNCGNGKTPWGTYLTCEENFNGYYASSDPDNKPSDALSRYGVGNEDWGYNWWKYDDRFDISKTPNEPNRHGYIVEIDPMNPTSTPKKRTALGRFKHENAAVALAADGRVVVYLGDDERGEFLYKFISEGKYAAGGNNSDLLEAGTLYVAKFSDDGKGEWVALTPASTGMASQAEICIHTRIAASAVGATTMDRPEWVACNPNRVEAYCSLTNNKNRGVKPNAGGDATPVNGPNPREKNLFGQVVRWLPAGGDHASDNFEWDLFVTAGNPVVHTGPEAGSSNVNADNMFNSPDGLGFDTTGLLWIQTDGNYKNKDGFAGQGNNQMLVGDPDTGEIKRFLVGPKECEITGITWSADRKTLFVGIQHPGEKGGSHYPAGGSSVPRSTVIAITRDDNELIG
ncbi:PhoX family phosphatase [Hwanghaeella grinnelliae]|uniref:PhoX family phosphatase n=1 Tax=Hwanghaeella grinnelliae TaxID=2500179 RepID=A0A3S3UKY4_9PROT|nr:PhoX family phosphatase [Hwanghaeella grinnelliae]RVU33685.1 PhoX family phosphatase [Hwanghaeella grinnelliae]